MLDARREKYIHGQKRGAFARTRRHVARRLQELSVTQPCNFSSAAGNVLRHESIESNIVEGIPSSRNNSMIEVKRMLNDARQ